MLGLYLAQNYQVGGAVFSSTRAFRLLTFRWQVGSVAVFLQQAANRLKDEASKYKKPE